MNIYEIMYRIFVVLVLGALLYLQTKQSKYLREKLDIAEKWITVFNVRSLLDQVKSHKELVEEFAEQTRTSEIEKIKKSYADKIPLTKDELVQFSREITKPIIDRYAKVLIALISSLIITRKKYKNRILDYIRQNSPDAFSDIKTQLPGILQNYIPSDKPFDPSELKP